MGWLQSQSAVLSQQRLNGSLLRKLHKESEEKKWSAGMHVFVKWTWSSAEVFWTDGYFFPTCLTVVTFCSIKPKQLFLLLYSACRVPGVLINDMKKSVYKTFRSRHPRFLKHSLFGGRAKGPLCVQEYLREGKDFFSTRISPAENSIVKFVFLFQK